MWADPKLRQKIIRSMHEASLRRKAKKAVKPECILAVTPLNNSSVCVPFRNPFQQAHSVRGLIADVARLEGLSHEHVRQVALGHRTSRRVAKALTAELRKRERQEQREKTA
jgi:hypothetical protein